MAAGCESGFSFSRRVNGLCLVELHIGNQGKSGVSVGVSISTSVAVYNDEFDLLALANCLLRQKLLIVFVTIVVLGVAVWYVAFSVVVYEGKSSILPPQTADIVGYNLGRQEAGLSDIEVKNVYSVFVQNLLSEGLRRDFFENIYLSTYAPSFSFEAKEELWSSFSNIISVNNPDLKNGSGRFEVVVRTGDLRQAAELANLYIVFAADKTRQDMARIISTEVILRVSSVRSQIVVLRESTTKFPEGGVSHVDEIRQFDAGKLSVDGMRQAFFLLCCTPPGWVRMPLISRIYIKPSDGSYSDFQRIRDLENQLVFLSRLDSRPDNVRLFSLDYASAVPAPIREEKNIIIGGGLIFGVMLGVCIAVLRDMLARRRKVIDCRDSLGVRLGNLSGWL